MTKENQTYHRDHLVRLYGALGWKTAHLWPNARLCSHLPQIADVCEGVRLPNEDHDLLDEILDGLELGVEFRVVGMPR